jgi:hypothetical protein
MRGSINSGVQLIRNVARAHGARPKKANLVIASSILIAACNKG